MPALAHTHPDCEVCTMSPDDATSIMQQGDPVAVILARMEVKLDNALTEQAKHSTTLERHDVRISKAEDRLTKVESTWLAEGVAGRLSAVERRVWTAVGAASLITGAAAAFIAKLIGA